MNTFSIEEFAGEPKYYPYCCIPKSMISYLHKTHDDGVLIKELGGTLPQINKEARPYAPQSTIDYKIEKDVPYLKEGCSSIATLLMGIIFIILALSSLGYESPGYVTLIFFTAGIFFIVTSVGFRKVQKYKSRKRPDDVVAQEYKKFSEECIEVNKINTARKEDYNRALGEQIEIYKSKFKEAELRIFRRTLSPSTSVVRNTSGIKRGRTELNFLGLLLNAFGNQIKVDVSIESVDGIYFPDFVFICDTTELQVDIEIDEPYDINEKQPIHFIESNEQERNSFFLMKNWVVVRFCEEQIAREPNECIEFLSKFIDMIRSKELKFQYSLKNLPRWTYEQSLVMAYQSYRNNY